MTRRCAVWQGGAGTEKQKQTMSNYKFITPGLWGDVTADEAVVELERIREKYGTLKPEMVVEESKPEGALLHKCFQWDDTKAADMWRKEQARQLIKNITVTVTNDSVSATVRAIVNVVTSESDKRSYVPLIKAIHDDASYQDLLGQAKADMESFIAKYSQLNELNAVKQAMLFALNGVEQD
jgi:hypothetical protein